MIQEGEKKEKGSLQCFLHFQIKNCIEVLKCEWKLYIYISFEKRHF